ARSSVDLETTIGSLTGLKRLLQSYPISDEIQPLLDKIEKTREIARVRREVKLESLLTDAFTGYRNIIDETGESRLDQSISKELQLNIFGARRVLEKAEIDENDRQRFVDELDDIEERFEKIRYLSSTTIFKRVYEPFLLRLRDEVDHTIDFTDVVDELNAT